MITYIYIYKIRISKDINTSQTRGVGQGLGQGISLHAVFILFHEIQIKEPDTSKQPVKKKKTKGTHTKIAQ